MVRAFLASCSIWSGKGLRCVSYAVALTKEGLPPRAQPGEQLGCRPPVGRQTELDLAVADGNAALEAEHAIDTADVIAALFQKLLQLAGLFEGDFRDVRAPSVHGRPAVETRRVIASRPRILHRLSPFHIPLKLPYC